jgi:hypothetical protein
MKLKKFRKTIISLAIEKVGESRDEALFMELDNQVRKANFFVLLHLI